MFKCIIALPIVIVVLAAGCAGNSESYHNREAGNTTTPARSKSPLPSTRSGTLTASNSTFRTWSNSEAVKWQVSRLQTTNNNIRYDAVKALERLSVNNLDARLALCNFFSSVLTNEQSNKGQSFRKWWVLNWNLRQWFKVTSNVCPNLLTQLLNAPNTDIRLKAVDFIGAHFNPGLSVPVVARLSDTDPVVRYAAKVAIEKNIYGTLPALIKLVSHPADNPVAVANATVILGDARVTNTEHWLIPLLENPDPRVVASAAYAAGRVHAVGALTNLAKLQESTNINVKFEASVALSAFGDRNVIPTLNTFAGQMASNIQSIAIGHVRPFCEALMSTNSLVRITATDESPVTEDLLPCALDETWAALHSLNDDSMVARALKSRSSWLKFKAAMFLTTNGDQNAANILRSIWNAPHPPASPVGSLFRYVPQIYVDANDLNEIELLARGIGSYYSSYLDSYGPSDALSEVDLGEGAVNPESLVAEALGDFGTNALPVVSRLLESTNIFSRITALQALGKIHSAAAEGMLVRHMKAEEMLIKHLSVGPKNFEALLETRFTAASLARLHSGAADAILWDVLKTPLTYAEMNVPRQEWMQEGKDTFEDSYTKMLDAIVRALTVSGEAKAVIDYSVDQPRFSGRPLIRILEKTDSPHAITPLLSLLNEWKFAPDAVTALSQLGWEPGNAHEQALYDLASRDRPLINADWNLITSGFRAILKGSDGLAIENVVFGLIWDGNENGIHLLEQALVTSGPSVSAEILAETYLNSGQEELASAARSWAERNGYKIFPEGGKSPVRWGGK